MWLSLQLYFNRGQYMNPEGSRGDHWEHSYRSLGVVNDKQTGGGGLRRGSCGVRVGSVWKSSRRQRKRVVGTA